MIEVFELYTESGRKRVSMWSTGRGAWVTVSPVYSNPIKMFQVRRLFWVQNVKDIPGLLDKV